MLTSRISFISFKKKSPTKQTKKKLKKIFSEKNQILNSLSVNYKNKFNIKNLKKLKNFKNFRVIGMGGSSLGTQAIYDFLNHKVKKNFNFIDYLRPKVKNDEKRKFANLVVSKSGETIETIANLSVLIKKKRCKYFYNRE